MTLRIAAGVILAFTVSLAAVIAGMSAASSFSIVGIDVETSDNTPRSLFDFDDCAAVSAGDTISIDVGVPEPGIADDRGLAGYQFRLFYDPLVLRVVADDSEQLMDQAPSSNLVPLADPKPDSDGVYFTAVVDFGPSGIEPDGTSEVGPGVIARVTLEAQAAGMSGLVLQDVILKDDSGEDIEIDSVQSASIYVGEPCPGSSPNSSPSATPAASATPTTTSAPSPSVTTGSGDGGSAPGVSSPSSGGPSGIVTAGGPPGSPGGPVGAAIIAGLMLAILGGAAAVAGLKASIRVDEIDAKQNHSEEFRGR
jgi:hypothetical protein